MAPSASILRRNQACFQCRKRKLKCDSKRPICTTCTRSYEYATRMARGAHILPLECTYSDSAEPPPQPEANPLSESAPNQPLPPPEALSAPESVSQTVPTLHQDIPDPRMEALEARIRIMEAQLRDIQDIPTTEASMRSMQLAEAGTATNTDFIPTTATPPSREVSLPSPLLMLSHSGTSPEIGSAELCTGHPLDLVPSGLALHSHSAPNVPAGWPRMIPAPELMVHLAETLFTCHPYASRLLHRSNFLASLCLQPDSPAFPVTSLLHGICAVASFYTSVIEANPLPDVDNLPPEGWLYRSHFIKKPNPNAPFGERHARLAHVTAFEESSRNMLQVLQSLVLISWFTYTSGSPTNTWIISSKAVYFTIPLGLNVGEGCESLSRYAPSAPSIIPPPKNAIEAEERRNTLWLVYVGERLVTSQVDWGAIFDDADVSQFLPLPDEDFNTGRTYPIQLRQRLTSPSVLTLHPLQITCPFSVLVKAAYLLSRVQTFNWRDRSKHRKDVDPRASDDFLSVDAMLYQFRSTWPEAFRDFYSDGNVDAALVMAQGIMHTAIILLHEPYADMSMGVKCISASKLIDSTKTMMESIYKISDTSFDFLQLDHHISYCWFVVGTALIKQLKGHIETASAVGVIKVNSDIDVIRHVLTRLGEKALIGRRHVKMLNETYEQEIGSPTQSITGGPIQPLAPCSVM